MTDFAKREQSEIEIGQTCCQVCGKPTRKDSQTNLSNKNKALICIACKKFFRRFSEQLALAKSTEEKEIILTCKCSSADLADSSVRHHPKLKLEGFGDDAMASSMVTKLTDTSGSGMCRPCRYQLCCENGLFDASGEKQKDPVNFKAIPCSVCGRPSTGYHFGTICCRGCKMFFARSIQRSEQPYMCEQVKSTACKFPCMSLLNDVEQSEVKISCRACRYEKCLAVGMSSDLSRIGRHSHQFRAKLRNGHFSNHDDDTANPGCRDKCDDASKISSKNLDTQYERGQLVKRIEEKNRNTEERNGAKKIKVLPDMYDNTKCKGGREILVANMKKPVEMSSRLWLYTRSLGKDFVDLTSNQTPSQKQHHLYQYLNATSQPISLAQQLNTPIAHRAEWLIGRLVQSVRVLDNIRSMEAPPIFSRDIFEIFTSSLLQYLQGTIKCALQFVKTLPGYEMLCVEDRVVLFTEAMYPLMGAEWAVNCDDATGHVKLLGWNSQSPQQSTVQSVRELAAVYEVMKNMANGINHANLSIVEFAIMLGLLFFDHTVSGLKDPGTVFKVRHVYLQSQNLFIKNQWHRFEHSCPENRSIDIFLDQRIQILNSQEKTLKVFRDFAFSSTQAFCQGYPQASMACPLFSELAEQIRRSCETLK